MKKLLTIYVKKYNFSFLNNVFCVKNAQRLRYKVKEKQANKQTQNQLCTPSDNHG